MKSEDDTIQEIAHQITEQPDEYSEETPFRSGFEEFGPRDIIYKPDDNRLFVVKEVFGSKLHPDAVAGFEGHPLDMQWDKPVRVVLGMGRTEMPKYIKVGEIPT